MLGLKLTQLKNIILPDMKQSKLTRNRQWLDQRIGKREIISKSQIIWDHSTSLKDIIVNRNRQSDLRQRSYVHKSKLVERESKQPQRQLVFSDLKNKIMRQKSKSVVISECVSESSESNCMITKNTNDEFNFVKLPQVP